MGPTNPAEAPPGTIRGDFGTVLTENLVHGSDGPESAEREIGIFFPGVRPEAALLSDLPPATSKARLVPTRAIP